MADLTTAEGLMASLGVDRVTAEFILALQAGEIDGDCRVTDDGVAAQGKTP